MNPPSWFHSFDSTSRKKAEYISIVQATLSSAREMTLLKALSAKLHFFYPFVPCFSHDCKAAYEDSTLHKNSPEYLRETRGRIQLMNPVKWKPCTRTLAFTTGLPAPPAPMSPMAPEISLGAGTPKQHKGEERGLFCLKSWNTCPDGMIAIAGCSIELLPWLEKVVFISIHALVWILFHSVILTYLSESDSRSKNW